MESASVVILAQRPGGVQQDTSYRWFLYSYSSLVLLVSWWRRGSSESRAPDVRARHPLQAPNNRLQSSRQEPPGPQQQHVRRRVPAVQ